MIRILVILLCFLTEVQSMDEKIQLHKEGEQKPNQVMIGKEVSLELLHKECLSLRQELEEVKKRTTLLEQITVPLRNSFASVSEYFLTDKSFYISLGLGSISAYFTGDPGWGNSLLTGLYWGGNFYILTRLLFIVKNVNVDGGQKIIRGGIAKFL